MRVRKHGSARIPIPAPDFERVMDQALLIVRERNWTVTVPALAEVSKQAIEIVRQNGGMSKSSVTHFSDKRIRDRLSRRPKLKQRLGVVPSSKIGRYAAAERRSSPPAPAETVSLVEKNR